MLGAHFANMSDHGSASGRNSLTGMGGAPPFTGVPLPKVEAFLGISSTYRVHVYFLIWKTRQNGCSGGSEYTKKVANHECCFFFLQIFFEKQQSWF